jgi:hypothetical protein
MALLGLMAGQKKLLARAAPLLAPLGSIFRKKAVTIVADANFVAYCLSHLALEMTSVRHGEGVPLVAVED